MNKKPSNILRMREYPLTIWAFSCMGIVVGIAILLTAEGFIAITIISALIAGSLLVGSLASVITLTVDKNQSYLTLFKRSLLSRSYLEYPLSEVETIEVESSDGSQVYRICIVLTSGARLPLHAYYSRGYNRKEKKARQLRQFINLKEPQPPVTGPTPPLRQLLSTTFTLHEQGTTTSVNWRLETGTLGDVPLIRWISPDFTLEAGFVYLAQKPKGFVDLFGSKGLSSIAKMLFQQSLKLYGFQPEDTPSLERARSLKLENETINAHFSIYASDEQLTQRMLGPWSIHPLLGWVKENPLKSLQPIGQETPGQLIVLYSPTGLYLVCLTTPDSKQAQDLAFLGADLVKAQGI